MINQDEAIANLNKQIADLQNKVMELEQKYNSLIKTINTNDSPAGELGLNGNYFPITVITIIAAVIVLAYVFRKYIKFVTS